MDEKRGKERRGCWKGAVTPGASRGRGIVGECQMVMGSEIGRYRVKSSAGVLRGLDCRLVYCLYVNG